MGRLENATRDKIAREASVWVVRLADPNAAPDQTRAFEAWRSQSPRHDVAYERAAAIFVGLGVQELSLSSAKIPHLKACLRRQSFSSLQKLAYSALHCHTAAEVRGLKPAG